jgi:hypothetical protein
MDLPSNISPLSLFVPLCWSLLVPISVFFTNDCIRCTTVLPSVSNQSLHTIYVSFGRPKYSTSSFHPWYGICCQHNSFFFSFSLRAVVWSPPGRACGWTKSCLASNPTGNDTKENQLTGPRKARPSPPSKGCSTPSTRGEKYGRRCVFHRCHSPTHPP